MTVSPLEALAAELGAVAARIEREVQLRVTAALSACDVRLAAVDAQMAELRAAAAQNELRAQNAERALAENVVARLAELKDGERGPEGTPGESIKGDRGDPGEPGKDADPEQVRVLVVAELEQAIKSLPVPADGHTPTEAELAPLVDAAVSRAFAAAPKPKDGADGKSVEPAEVERMVADVVAKLPPAEQGAPGKTAYELAVEAGFSGDLANWLESLRGPPGDKGDAGESVKGDAGPCGADGAQGMLPLVKAWEPGVTYRAEVKTHASGTWQALRDTGTEPGGEDWACLAPAGRSPRHRGTWNAETEYSALDVVNLNGGQFTALRDAPGACPGDGWTMGPKQGKAGPPGPKGERGERGVPGPPMPVPSIRLFMEDDTVLVAEFGEQRASIDLYDVLRETQRGVPR